MSEIDFSGPLAAQPTDTVIIGRVLAGDRECFALLVRCYQDGLYRHALGMLADHDAAADVVQDSLIKAYSKLRYCRDRTRFRTWLFRIVRNSCLDYLKDQRRNQVPLEELSGSAAADEADVPLDRLVARQEAARALVTLPSLLREAFLLRHLQELSYEEMAEVLDEAPGTLRMRVLRAREGLRSALCSEGAQV